jgi:hypothetical protein
MAVLHEATCVSKDPIPVKIEQDAERQPVSHETARPQMRITRDNVPHA